MNRNLAIKSIPDLLLQEAVETLNYGLKYYNDYLTSDDETVIKQAIINLHRFAELILKYFVAKINPLLVFTSSFDKIINLKDEFKTISFDEALIFYINNLEHGLISYPSGYSRNEIETIFTWLKKLRNKITHWFLSTNDTDEVTSNLNTVLELIYFLCQTEEISTVVYSDLSHPNQLILDDLINTQKEKLEHAIEEASLRITNALHDPKELEPDAPLCACPSCGNETFVLCESNDNEFECTFCDYKEEAGECSLSLICNPGKLPTSYLSSWNEDDSSMICDECEDEFHHRANKD